MKTIEEKNDENLISMTGKFSTALSFYYHTNKEVQIGIGYDNFGYSKLNKLTVHDPSGDTTLSDGVTYNNGDTIKQTYSYHLVELKLLFNKKIYEEISFCGGAGLAYNFLIKNRINGVVNPQDYLSSIKWFANIYLGLKLEYELSEKAKLIITPYYKFTMDTNIDTILVSTAGLGLGIKI